MKFWKWFLGEAWFHALITLVCVCIAVFFWGPGLDRTIAIWWFSVLLCILVLLKYLNFRKQ